MHAFESLGVTTQPTVSIDRGRRVEQQYHSLGSSLEPLGIFWAPGRGVSLQGTLLFSPHRQIALAIMVFCVSDRESSESCALFL